MPECTRTRRAGKGDRPAACYRDRHGRVPPERSRRRRRPLDLLAAWIESHVAYAGLPGLSIGIVHDQELVWARGFGHASLERGEPATPETLYRIASITKLFTTTAILQLRDAGRLRLDDPVVEHLPWFAIQQSHPGAPAMTVRHLLTHTAGLPPEW